RRPVRQRGLLPGLRGARPRGHGGDLGPPCAGRLHPSGLGAALWAAGGDAQLGGHPRQSGVAGGRLPRRPRQRVRRLRHGGLLRGRARRLPGRHQPVRAPGRGLEAGPPPGRPHQRPARGRAGRGGQRPPQLTRCIASRNRRLHSAGHIRAAASRRRSNGFGAIMRLTSASALLAFLLACAPTAARADYAAGLQAYDNKDYTTAYMEWLPLAKQGDAKAQHGLALLYETGNGVPVKDDVEAAKWYAAAALQGIAESQANLALMFAEGRGVKQDYNRAASLWEQAADKGVAVANYDLGLLYLNGYGVDKDPAQAAKWFEKAAELKVVDAQYAIARLYR